MPQNEPIIILKDGSFSHEESRPEHHIFTTVRIEREKAVLWEQHEKRLLHDARQIGTVWDIRRKEIIDRVAQNLKKGALRVTCTVDSWWIHAWKTSIDESAPLKTCWVEWNHRALLPAFVKHGYRSIANELAKERGVDVLLWKNSKGEALEASFGNIFSIVDGCLYTPPARGNILDGIGRRSLIHVATALGIPVYENPILATQGCWWMTSSLRTLQKLDISKEEECIVPLRRAMNQYLCASFYDVQTQEICDNSKS